MGCYLFIALCRHSEREILVCYLDVLLMSCHCMGACSPKVSKPKKGSLKDQFGLY